LVSKYYTENLLVDEKCYPYLSRDGKCGSMTAKCEKEMVKKYKIDSY